MPLPPRKTRELFDRHFFESRTETWRQVGLGAEVDREKAHRAQGGIVVMLVLIAGVLLLFSQRQAILPGLGTPVRVATVVALVVLGWGLARALGRGLAPALFRRMEPGTAGVVGFLIRLVTIAIMLIVALRIAGLNASALAVGGAFTAVVVGLAAQQTVGNLFAGMVMLGTRPFRVGDRVRFVGGAMAGSVEGIVSSLGLFYTTLIDGADRMMVPNSVLLQLAVVPIREPERIELRARFDATTTPSEVQRLLLEGVTVATRYPPHIELEELDHEQVVVRIAATPVNPTEGAELAGQILAAVRNAGGARGDAGEREPVGAAPNGSGGRG